MSKSLSKMFRNERLKRAVLIILAIFISFSPIIMAEEAEGEDEFKISEPGTLPIVEEGELTLTLGLEQSSQVENYDTNQMTEYIEDHTGINLEFVVFPADEMMTKLELMVTASGEDLPDVLLGAFKHNVILPWAQAGMILPLNEYYDELFYWGNETLDTTDTIDLDDIKKYITSSDGNIYGVYGYNSTLNNCLSGSRLNIYRPWLEKLGLDMPKTTDDLYEMLIAFRDNDLNENGIDDEIPLTGYNEGGSLANVRRYLMTPFIYTQNDYWTNNDGEIGVAFNQEEWREGIRFANKLFEEDLMDPALFTQDSATMTVTLSQDEQVVGSFFRFSSTNMSGDDPNRYLYDRSEQLTGPDGETRTSVNKPLPGLNGLITKNCPSPEAAFMLLDYLNSYDLSVITRFGYLGEDFEELDMEAERAKLEEFWEEQPRNYPVELYGEDYELPVNKYSYDPATWGVLQNKWWGHNGQPNTMTEEMNRLFTAAGSIDTERDQWAYVSEFRHYYFLQDGAQYWDDDLIVTGLVYTEDEQDVITDYYTEILSFVDESWAAFVTGAQDIDDDAAWENYLNTIDKMNLDECIEVTQACFDRMNNLD